MKKNELLQKILEQISEDTPKTMAFISLPIIGEAKKLINKNVIPSELFVCPYKNTFDSSNEGREDKLICDYHCNTGVKPTKLDCYICRLGEK